MDKLFEKIYSEVIVYEKDMVALIKAAERRNDGAALQYKGKLDEKGIEELAGLLDDTAMDAGKEGFYMGMRYAFRLIFAMLKG